MPNRKTICFNSTQDLTSHIETGEATFYHSSQTSTVIPYEKLDDFLRPNTVLGNLSTLKGSLLLTSENNLLISGFVTWREAKAFCLSKGREIMTSPTEELAGVLAGIATSCTGERSFGFGNLRAQIRSLNYIGYEGKETVLFADRPLQFPPQSVLGLNLHSYQNDLDPYSDFKNAPYPRLEFETDLMTGLEGQLGVITGAEIKTIPYEAETYLGILLPKWEEDFKGHLELFHAIRFFRGKILACEFIDSNSLAYLEKAKNPGENQDLIFLEIKKCNFEEIYEELLVKFILIKPEQVFEIPRAKYHDLRMSVPRAIFEVNAKMGVVKKGTDVQVGADKFSDLLFFYREFSKLGIKYNLFGHFGDAHLHFNFMPTVSEVEKCNTELERLYEKVLEWKGSPFAEHGIGLIKKKFIAPFYSENQRKIFRELKKIYDPKEQFFPEGFMSC